MLMNAEIQEISVRSLGLLLLVDLLASAPF